MICIGKICHHHYNTREQLRRIIPTKKEEKMNMNYEIERNKEQ